MIKMKSTLMVATILAIAILLFGGEAPDEAAPTITPPTPIYMVEYDAGPSYLPGRPFAEQPGIMEHGAYMDQLHDAGILVFGGPFFDDLDSLVMTGAFLFLNVSPRPRPERSSIKTRPSPTGFSPSSPSSPSWRWSAASDRRGTQ